MTRLWFKPELQTSGGGFAFVGLGSIATQLMMPYSDLEYLLLLSPERAKIETDTTPYRRLAKLIEMLIVSLGESPPRYTHSVLEATPVLGTLKLSDFIVYQSYGLRIDAAKNPIKHGWHISLINTIDYFTSKKALKDFRDKDHFSMSLLNPAFLCILISVPAKKDISYPNIICLLFNNFK